MDRWKDIHGLDRLRQEFLDQVWGNLGWLAFILVPFSLARMVFTGWLPLYSVHIGLGVAVVLIALNRKRLGVKYKAPMLVGLFWLVGLNGVWAFGLASAGLWWLMMGVVICGAVYSMRRGIVMGGVVLLVLMLFMLGFSSGYLDTRTDLNQYNAHPAAWINMVIGTALCLVVVVHSILLYHRALVRETEHRFQQWVEDMPTAMLVLNNKAEVSFANARAKDILGEVAQAGASRFDRFYCAGSDTPYPVRDLPPVRALRGEQSMIDDVELQVNGERVCLQIWGKPGLDWRGNASFAIATFEDITERRRAETLKSEFVARVSHELRTPLTSIHGSLGLIRSGAVGELTETMRSVLTIACNNSDRLLLLINDLLDIQKITAGRMDFHIAPIDIMPLVRRLMTELAAYANQFDVSFQLNKSVDDTEQVMADEHRLVQALGNLMSNGAKFSPLGSSVTLDVECVSDNKIRIAVRDNGAGIPEQFKSQIFQPFTQADTSSKRGRGGTGLGLAIAKELIECQQGEIGFTSDAEQGTCFYIILPRVV